MNATLEILHAVPGRVRARVPELKNNFALEDAVCRRLMSKPGVREVRVNRACASVVIGYDTAVLKTFIPESHLQGLKIEQCNGGAVCAVDSSVNRGAGRIRDAIRRFASLILPTAALLASRATRLLPIAPVYAIVAAAALPVFTRTAMTIRREKRVGVDFLDATALAIMGIQKNLPTCAFMAWLISIGEHIREETARKSQKAIADLLAFHAETVTILVGRRRVIVPADRVKCDCLVVVNAGDVIPVDGRVVSGCAGVDQMSLTGESSLREKSAGDTVFAGSLAVDGELVIRSSAVGLNTRAGKIVQALRSAPMQETRIEDYAARFADRLVDSDICRIRGDLGDEQKPCKGAFDADSRLRHGCEGCRADRVPVVYDIRGPEEHCHQGRQGNREAGKCRRRGVR